MVRKQSHTRLQQTNDYEAAEKLLDAINDTASTLRSNYLTFLLAGTYMGVIVASTTDVMLIKDTPVTLPLLNVQLPITSFYAVVPWLLIMLHFYLILHHYLLSKRLRGLYNYMQYFHDKKKHELHQRLISLPFVQLFLTDNGHGLLLRLVLKFIVLSTLVAFPLLLLCWAQMRFLPYHHELITNLHRGAIFLDIIIIWSFLLTIIPQSTHSRWERWIGLISWLLALTLCSALALFLAIFSTVPYGQQAYLSHSKGKPLPEICFDQKKQWAGKQFENYLLYYSPQWLIHVDEQRQRCMPFPTYLIYGKAKNQGNGRKIPDVLSFTRNLDVHEALLVANQLDAESINMLRHSEGEVYQRLLQKVIGLNLDNRDLRFANMESAILPKAELREALLQGAKLYKAQMQGANLWHAELQGATFSLAQMQHVNFLQASLQGADFFQANLSETEFRGTNLQYVNFQAANLHKAKLQGANLRHAILQDSNLSEAKLQKTNLSQANFQKANLIQANLQQAVLIKAQFQESDLSLTNMQRSDLSFANFQEAIFFKAKLQKAILSQADFQKADFSEANLSYATLTRSNFQGASFHKANLQYSHLTQSNFQDADLSSSRLYRAHLGQANLQNADLSASNLQQSDLTGANLHQAKLIFSTLDASTLAAPNDQLSMTRTHINNHPFEPMAQKNKNIHKEWGIAQNIPTQQYDLGENLQPIQGLMKQSNFRRQNSLEQVFHEASTPEVKATCDLNMRILLGTQANRFCSNSKNTAQDNVL